MPANIPPRVVKESTAARMLDMKPAEFRRLWQAGHLPPPQSVGGCERWVLDDLVALFAGQAARPDQGLEV